MFITTLLAAVLLQPVDSTPNLVVEKSIKIEIDQLQTDVLEKIYVLTGNTLRKFSAEGKELCHFTNNNLGIPASFDCSDPLNIQLFYPDQNKIVYVDQTLSQLNQALSLDAISSSAPIAICNSAQASFWVLNKQELKLQCYNRNFELLIQSQPLNEIIRSNSQCKLTASENQLLLLVKGKGVYLFNHFGEQQRFFPEAKAEIAILRNNTLYISTKTGLQKINSLTGKKINIPNPQSQMFIFPLSDKKYIGFSPKGFSILTENK